MSIKDDIKKEWYKSRTLIFNVISVGLVALEANTSYLKDMFNINVYMIASVAIPMINFYLRTITTQAIGKKDENTNT